MGRPGYLVIGGPQPPKPREFGPCPKCEADNTYVVYHAGHPLGCTEWVCREARRKDEHLSVMCVRCGFRWLEDVSSPASGPCRPPTRLSWVHADD
jgi:hypothetical protein